MTCTPVFPRFSIPTLLPVPLLLLAACIAACIAACTNGPEGSATASPPDAPPEALEHAWRFAEAITRDAKDRNRARARVAGAMLAAGHVERAKEMADHIDNWRRGVLYADIVHYQVLNGIERFPNADLLTQARMVAREAEGWRRVRVHEHVGMAHAALGESDEIRSLRTRFKTDNAARGKLGAFLALALAREGKPGEAMEVIESLGDSDNFDIHIWNPQGLLMLAEEGGVSVEERREVLDKAWIIADEVPGFRKHQIKMAVIEQWGAEADPERAGPAMEEVEAAVLALGLPAHIKAPLMGEVVLSWAKQGNADRVAALAPKVVAEIESDTIYEIERPAATALLAEAHAIAGNRERALEVYRIAIEQALPLVNRRPRALAAEAIALSLHRSGLDPRALEDSLNRLHATFDESVE